GGAALGERVRRAQRECSREQNRQPVHRRGPPKARFTGDGGPLAILARAVFRRLSDVCVAGGSGEHLAGEAEVRWWARETLRVGQDDADRERSRTAAVDLEPEGVAGLELRDALDEPSEASADRDEVGADDVHVGIGVVNRSGVVAAVTDDNFGEVDA